MRIRIILATTFFCIGLSQIAHADNHNSQEFHGFAVGMTDVVVTDMDGYIDALKREPDLFNELGSVLTGVCRAVTGARVPGEASVYSFYPSIKAAMTAINLQQTNASISDFAASLTRYREFSGNSIRRVLRASAAGLSSNWAARSVLLSTDDTDAYIRAVDIFEEAFRQHGFNDVAVNIYQEVGSGNTSDLLIFFLETSSLTRLGEILDVAYSQQWAQEAYADVVSNGVTIIEDKMYSCENVYSGM